MKKIKILWNRFIKNFGESFLFGTCVAVIVFYIYTVFDIVTGGQSNIEMLEVLLGIHVFAIIFSFVLKSRKNFHKYDSELIGRNFIGKDKKCKIFNESMELLFAQKTNYALRGFQKLEESYTSETSNEEKAIIDFYIARCYDIMNYYPNAVKYYTRAEEKGFVNDLLSFLLARCWGNVGDTEQALEMYGGILSDEKNPLKVFVNVDIGRMYIKENDGENALKYFSKAIENRECYADALAGAAIANLMLDNIEEAMKLNRMAVLNHLSDCDSFQEYFKSVLKSRTQKK